MKTITKISLTTLCLFVAHIHASDYSQKIQEAQRAAEKIIDTMMFSEDSIKYRGHDQSIEHAIKTKRTVYPGNTKTSGPVVHTTGNINQYIHQFKNELRKNESYQRRLLHKVEMDKEIDDAADEVLKATEIRVKEDTKQLISNLIPQRSLYSYLFDENYLQYSNQKIDQYCRIPYAACNLGLKSRDTDCEAIKKEMAEFAKPYVRTWTPWKL